MINPELKRAPRPQKAIPSQATTSQEDQLAEKIGRLKLHSQIKVIEFARAVMTKHKQFNTIYDKMDAIDVAYARYKAKESTTSGVDALPEAKVCCGDVFGDDDVTPPIVVSQVDSYVAYLSEVFLSGAPLFPVASNPANKIWAEQLESLLDDHASIGGYARQILLFLRDGIKYNFSACEVKWDSIEQFSVMENFLSDGQKVKRAPKKFSRITRLNPRNVLWDWSVSPGDVSEHGDYAGYVDRITDTKLKRLLNKLTTDNKIYNADTAMMSGGTNASGFTQNYREDPQISEYVSKNPDGRMLGVNWDAWFDAKQANRQPPKGQTYEIFKLYARIMPADFGITAPQPNTPQIWKFVIVNSQIMVSAERIISAYDYLPILFGQPLEDGLGYQTQSVAESEIPFQKAAATLFNIRFAAARRAVSDRALYIPDMIKPSDINNPTAAPKIPVHLSVLSQKGIDDAYKQIPFDMRGTESTIQDAATIVSFSKELHGVNNPKQGQFQKGNKSVKEWDDTMSGSDGRMRLPALVLEHQFFSPLKSIITLNLFQYGQDAVVTSQVTGQTHDIKIDQLRQKVLSFKIADGYTPKSKMASTEVILAGMQMIGASPILQQAYGMRLPSMFAHFMSLSGLKGFEEYDPNNPANAPATPDAGLAPNDLQQQPALPQPAAPVDLNAQPVV